MVDLLRRLRAPGIALIALALSASLALGAQAPAAWGQAAHRPAGSTVGLAGDEEAGDQDEAGTDEDAGGDEDADTDEDTGSDEDADQSDGTQAGAEDAPEDTGDSCTVDPTAATPEELDAMNHGAMVCWAAQQTTWPEWFSNHGAFVRCWAHQGKADAVSCTEDPTTLQGTDGGPTLDAPVTHGKGHALGKAKGKGKHQG